MKRYLSAALVVAFGALSHTAAHGQDFPPKQITIIVGFGAGGGTDIFARLFGDEIEKALGATVIIANRPGAAGTIGTGMVARAAPNGQTLLFTPANIATTKALYKNLPFDPQRDLAPISMTARIPFILVVHPSVPARNVKELVQLAKRTPAILNYGSSGPGSFPYFAMELLKFHAGIDLRDVPYKGSSTVLIALISGEVDASFQIPPLALPHMRSGKMRGLAVSTVTRSSALPDLPSLHEAGISGFEMAQWHAFFTPAKTPPATINALNSVIVKALATPQMKKRLSSEGAEIAGSTPAELAALLASEIKKYAEQVQRLGLKLD